MKCKNCGAELNADYRFCRKCGTPIDINGDVDTDAAVDVTKEAGKSENMERPRSSNVSLENQETKEEVSKKSDANKSDVSYQDVETEPENKLFEKKKNSKWILISLAVVLLVGGIGGGSLIVNASRTSEYQETISLANRYYNQLDYERAEELYLHSIDILPKQKDPYIQLVQIYTLTEQPQKAEDIVAKAQGNLSGLEAEEVKQKADEAAKEMEKQKAQEAARLAEAERLALQQPAYKAYAGILRQMLDGYYPAEFSYNNIFDNGKLYVDSKISKPILQYSLKDLDGDNIDELQVRYDGTTYKGSWRGDSQSPLRTMGLVFKYHPESEKTELLFDGAFNFIPMTNGYIKVLSSPDQFVASKNCDLVSIRRLKANTDRERYFLYIEEFDRQYIEDNFVIDEHYLGTHETVRLVFPSEYDHDNDGLLYRFLFYDSMEEQLLDKQAAEQLFDEITDQARSIDLIYEDVTDDVIVQLENGLNG